MPKPHKPVEYSWITENIPPELANSSLFKFDVIMPDKSIIKVDLLSVIDVDYEKLEQQLCDTPSQFSWFAVVLAELKAQVYVLERKCKGRRGFLTNEMVTIGRETGSKLPADQIKVVIESDEILQKMEVKLAGAQATANKLHHMVEALKMKSEHLRSLAGFKRQDREAHR